MIRLDLLPDYVFEPQRIRRAIIVCTLLLLADIGVTVAWLQTEKNRRENMTRQAAQATEYQQQVQAVEAEIGEVTAQIQPLDDQREYMLALKDYGDAWPERMRALSRYIYRGAEVLSAGLNPEGFELQVRTKTTDDVARLLMNLKQAYAAGLVQPNTLNIAGLTGWPNLTSPRGWTGRTMQHMTVPSPGGGLSAVNSRTRLGSGGGGAAAGGGGGGGGMPGEPGMEMAPPDAGAPPADAGAPPGDPGGGFEGEGGGGGGGGDGLSPEVAEALRGRLPKEVLQMLLSPLEAARLEYLEPSVEPPPQPYLNLQINGTWAQPIEEPQAPGAAPAPGGMDPGMMDPGAMPPGDAMPPGEGAPAPGDEAPPT